MLLGARQQKGYVVIPKEQEKTCHVKLEPARLGRGHEEVEGLLDEDGAYDEDDNFIFAHDRRRRSHCQRRYAWILDKRFTVPLACLLVTLALSIHFDCPSTLYLYLAYLFVGFPMDIIYEALQHRHAVNTKWGLAEAKSSNKRIGKVRFLHLAKMLMALSIWCWALACPLLSSSPLKSTTIGTGVASSLLPTTTSASLSTSKASNPVSQPQGPIYIAANLYNSAHLFPRFTTSLLDLIDSLGGPSNVYVSLYESNSADGGKLQQHLAHLDGVLASRNVSRRIHWGGDTFNEVRVGKESRKHGRIRYLAKVRNEALRPLDEGLRGIDGKDFTKVLWMNDIVYDVPSIMTLLDTMGGAYDLACAFDYISLGLYDTWVTRDVGGYRTKPLWPYFARETDVEKLRRREPILVNSCWNGAAVFDAKWFVLPSAEDEALPASDSSDDVAGLPVRFRTSPKCHSSECLLASLDIHKYYRQTDPTSRPRIYMNPLVSVAYEKRIYSLYNGLMRWTIVQPWHVAWEGWISSRLFKRWSDIGRKDPSCREAFKDDWVAPSLPRSDEKEDVTIVEATSK